MKFECPDYLVYAMYLALQAARRQALGVRFDNNKLKWYLLGKKPGKRLSQRMIHEFAKEFEPVFQDHEVEYSEGSMNLVLYLQKKDIPVGRKRIINEWLPSEADIVKELGRCKPIKR